MSVDRGVADGAEKEAIAGQLSSSTASASSLVEPTAGSAIAAGIASVRVGVGMDSGHRAAHAWRADEQLMAALTSMGISAIAAKKALFYTNNASAELATAWIFENPDSDLDTPLELEVANDYDNESDQQSGISGARLRHDVYKMVFVVNASLEMGVGKIAAQVAHAALGMHQLLLQDETKFGDSLIRWFEFGETKIVLKGETTQHLIELEKRALTLGLPTYLVQDAGKTQVKSGSTTVLCLFGRVDKVDQISGNLRLL